MTQRDALFSCLCLAGLLLSGCTTESDAPAASSEPNLCRDSGSVGATASCLSPTRSAEYYAEQASRYFDTLDTAADPNSIPDYAPLVARWEWPPWLLLTGYGRQDMISVSETLRKADPSTVPTRDCRGFDAQPFARCYVVFEYEHGPCPIYEEFTFNDEGQMTFIEAWSDAPGLQVTTPEDRWAEAASFPRLANRIAGLGNEMGAIDLQSSWMKAAARRDPDVADFALRASDWWTHWFKAVAAAEPNYFAKGCGW